MYTKELTTEIDKVILDLEKQEKALDKKIEKEVVGWACDPEKLLRYSVELKSIRATWRAFAAIKGKMSKAWDKESV